MKYPGLKIDLQPTIDIVDFRNNDLDLAIRHGKGDWKNLNTIKLFNELLVPVATPVLIQTIGNNFFREETLLSAPLENMSGSYGLKISLMLLPPI
ncbi:MAG: LysR family glycine cleavage system transcriptional activator [Gammaproteobacteria bacterium]|jgi:LysR family glycine cleavage system transcriptional activator